MSKVSVEYSERVLTYVDALGFRELISSSETSLIDRIAVDPALMRIEREHGREFPVSTFSDHIVGSMPRTDPNLSRLFNSVVDFSMALIANVGFLVRGAITVGPLVHNSKVIYGPALVDAFELEHDIAVYPRIIVDEKVPIPGDIFEGIRRGEDEMLYVDFFWRGWTMLTINWSGNQGYREEQLSLIGHQIEKRLSEVTNRKAHSKIAWFAHKFNEAIERNNDKVPPIGRVPAREQYVSG